MECAGPDLWLVDDLDREVRRDRCMSEEIEQLEPLGQGTSGSAVPCVTRR